jgi:hypothetical protein
MGEKKGPTMFWPLPVTGRNIMAMAHPIITNRITKHNIDNWSVFVKLKTHCPFETPPHPHSQPSKMEIPPDPQHTLEIPPSTPSAFENRKATRLFNIEPLLNHIEPGDVWEEGLNGEWR